MTNKTKIFVNYLGEFNPQILTCPTLGLKSVRLSDDVSPFISLKKRVRLHIFKAGDFQLCLWEVVR